MRTQRKEIVLPYDLFHRIRISSEEHGGIGRGYYFDADGPTGTGTSGEPFCAHGHAWGTCDRMNAWVEAGHLWPNPELRPFLHIIENDQALANDGVGRGERIPFTRWCELLNVKCAPKPEPAEQNHLVGVR